MRLKELAVISPFTIAGRSEGNKISPNTNSYPNYLLVFIDLYIEYSSVSSVKVKIEVFIGI
ncbi:hypothetical protein AUJ42_00360 [Candidatus Collierbacteria bacterium CG1_02_44_10]|uniref:Uncharacterized protein n=1 Tax=Candidatus Collierbacteria bacterium CG1_02_44_10 TaxID=1805087 RepID=A0A1J4S2I9_9BACT|nr:MAG: hypothetical protein AUJ42_00360 [Candidatus Collierbacteria bacterium CG1_02_44_10]